MSDFSKISPNFNIIAKEIIGMLSEQIPHEHATLQLIKGENRYQISGLGFDSQSKPEWLDQPISQDPLISKLVYEKKIMVFSITEGLVHSQYFHNIGSWIGIPLIYEEKVVGLVFFDHSTPELYNFSDQELRDIEVLTKKMAPKMQQLYEYLDPALYLQKLELISKIIGYSERTLEKQQLLNFATEQISKYLKCTHCAFFEISISENNSAVLKPSAFWDTRDRKITREFIPGEGIVGWVYSHEKPVLLTDATQDERFSPRKINMSGPLSMVAVPVRIGDKSIGVIIADQDAFGWFTEDSITILETLASHIGIAIERNMAFATFLNVSKQMMYSIDLDSVLTTIVSGG